MTVSVLQVPVTSADHIQGDAHAPVTLVEYGDYQCPACGMAYPVVKAVQKHFGKRLRFVFRNFPLTQIHPEAEGAAEVAWALLGDARRSLREPGNSGVTFVPGARGSLAIAPDGSGRSVGKRHIPIQGPQ